MFESDLPEFIVSESLFTWRLQCIESAALRNLPVVVYYTPTNELTQATNSREDDAMKAYSGTLKGLLPNSNQEPNEHLMNSGFGTMEVAWDDGSDDSVLSPWEVTLKDKVDDTPLPPHLEEAKRRAIGDALAKIETNPIVKEFFLRPVDERRYPDYRNRVEVPMDFSFIKERLAAGYYCGIESALADAKLVKENCIKYNGRNDLSHSASAICDEFEHEVRSSIESGQRSASFEPLNDAASQVDSSRATRHAQRQQQGPSTRRSSTEATSLEQLPLPKARHSEGRPSRRSRQGQNEEPSRVVVAPRRVTRSGTASSEVLEEARNEGDRSIRAASVRDYDEDDSFQAEHDQEDFDAPEELSEAYSSEGQSESDPDDDVAPTRRSHVHARPPSRQHAVLGSRRTNRALATRKDAESPMSNYGDGSSEETLASDDLEDEHSSEEENESPPVSPRRSTRASALTSRCKEPRTTSRRSRAHANSTEKDESPPAAQRRSSRSSAAILRREEPRTSPRRTRAHANSTESPPALQRRASRASAATSHRQGLSGGDANSTEETWSTPRRARPKESMADLSHSEVDDDDDSFEVEDRVEVPQRQTGKRGASERSSGES